MNISVESGIFYRECYIQSDIRRIVRFESAINFKRAFMQKEGLWNKERYYRGKRALIS